MRNFSRSREKHQHGELSLNIITKLLDVIPEGSTVLELGTGNGTLDLVEKFKVISIENDKHWYRGVSDLILAPLVEIEVTSPAMLKRFPDFHQWYDPSVIQREISTREYDAIVVDGPSSQARRPGFYYFKELFNLSVPIILDDVQRPYDIAVATLIATHIKATEFQIFDFDRGKLFARVLP